VNPALRFFGGLAAVGLLAETVLTYKSTAAVQRGFPGVAMEQIEEKSALLVKAQSNAIPFTFPPATQDGKLAVDSYKNVQVLGHLPSGEFTRLMTAMTTWVSPNEGCAYCHAPQRDAKGNIVRDADGAPQADLNAMWSDELYTKRVARRMIQMTMRINGEWKEHVKATGVTCYTCHRGQPVPANIWFDQPPDTHLTLGNRVNQNQPAASVGYSSLPTNSLRYFLAGDDEVRIQSTVPLTDDTNRASIKQAEWTYGLMMYISGSLGVNCTHCHNTRSMGVWDMSPPQRAQAWHGIRLTRELNKSFLEPLLSTFPANRLGPTGDAPKAGCATCHAGAYRPLLGVSMLKDYQALAEAKPQPTKTPDAPPAVTADGGVPANVAPGGDGGAPTTLVPQGDGGVPLTAAADGGLPDAAGAKPQPLAPPPGRRPPPAPHP
jgi:photosynthetic reaction center cytochrome c subunit